MKCVNNVRVEYTAAELLNRHCYKTGRHIISPQDGIRCISNMDKVFCSCNKLSRPLTTVICQQSRVLSNIQTSFFSTSNKAENKSKLVIVGGGCGGTAAANIFTRKLGAGQVTVIEPSDVSVMYNMYFVWTVLYIDTAVITDILVL